MSTQTGKCPGCGEDKLRANCGVIVYVCGTTVSQDGMNRPTLCHAIETATLQKRITALEAHVARLEDAGNAMAESYYEIETDEFGIERIAAWQRAKEAKP